MRLAVSAEAGRLDVKLVAGSARSLLAAPVMAAVAGLRDSRARFQIVLAKAAKTVAGYRPDGEGRAALRRAPFADADRLVEQLIVGDTLWIMDGGVPRRLAATPAAIALAVAGFDLLFALSVPLEEERLAA